MQLKLLFFGFILLFWAPFASFSKNNKEERTIKWLPVQTSKMSETLKKDFLSFEGAFYESKNQFLPAYFERIKLNPGDDECKTEIANPVFTPVSESELKILEGTASLIGGEINISAVVGYEQKEPYALISFIPLRKNPSTGRYERLTKFDLVLNAWPSAKLLTAANKTYANNSVLATGNWYKIGVTTDGIYKLPYSFFKTLGIDVSTLDPRNIRIYGNGGGMLPENNSKFRHDDLVENAIIVEGENDGVFNTEDYVLFYGQGPNRWTYNSSIGGSCPKFRHTIHLYSDTTYYFINVDLGQGKRMITQSSSLQTPNKFSSSFDDFAYHEKNERNLILSGREWYGESIETKVVVGFNFPFIDFSSPVSVKVDLVGRHTNDNFYTVKSGAATGTVKVSGLGVSSYTGEYARTGNLCFAMNPSNASVSVEINKDNADAMAWLNYVEVNVRRNLQMFGEQLIFRDVKTLGAGNVTKFSVTIASKINVWDVTNPVNVKLQEATLSGNQYEFTVATDTLREFIAFTGNSYLSATTFGKVENQNLHAISQKDFIIVTAPDFMSQATALANLHSTRDTMRVAVVTPRQIYNEFSSGAQDISAIRDFVKMLYDRGATVSERPRYLLLLGNGSYDPKRRLVVNTNFVPTYQSYESLAPTDSYVTDDFFGLMDANEGTFNAGDLVDIGIGRMPVKNVTEAQSVLNKIYKYISTGSPGQQANACVNETASPMGDWRNNICFIADDEDGALHSDQAQEMADSLVGKNYKYFNVNKIYMDAYQQQSTPGGNRFFEATKAITKQVEKGALIVNYTGHGGELGLAHERVLEIADINNWVNLNNLPFFVTATCEFSRYDNPALVSGGEYLYLNPNGGAIGLLTTVRLVYANSNITLNKNFYRNFLKPVYGGLPRMGDLCRITKVTSGTNPNNLNFTLFGDPALRLAYPKYTIVTGNVSTLDINSSQDTIKALSTVKVSGYVKGLDGDTLKTFNGTIYPTIYDKAQVISTLSNDGASESPVRKFSLQKNILYKGKASVVNGKFSFSFVVPKDIAYQYGLGKISYYAENGVEDATGFYNKLIIGGTASKVENDVVGPSVKLYLNNDKFVFGGITNENPQLFAIFKDSTGINTVGNGIGHDITCFLDNKTDNVIVLNDYYQADLNSYKGGQVRYTFNNLTEGKHTMTLKVWDVHNNSSTSYTEFVVAKSAELALSHVLNYPNPFTTKTNFYFENNHCCESLSVQLQIFTVSGKLVKTINTLVNLDGFRSEPIEWDGRDDFGDRIGKGVYIYHLKVKTNDGKLADKIEKLVILN